MAAVTEDDNPGEPPVASGGAAGAAPDAGPAGEEGDQGSAAQENAAQGSTAAPGELDGQAAPADEAADDAAAQAADDAAAQAADDAAVQAADDAAGEDGSPGAGEDEEGPEQPSRDVADLEQESEIAADYVEGLLDVADLDGDIDMDVEGDRALVSVVGATLQELVGPRGEVLEALQELTRLAVHRQTGVRTRIMLDVGGYRARRRMELTALGRDAAEDVSRTGVARRLDPMTPFERKIIHDAVAAAGLRSESEGEEPNRRVVVLPAG
jgi:spoIIIJ-associated protein